MTADRSRQHGIDAPKTADATHATASTDYDHRSDQIERPDLRDALESRVAGDVRFDTYSRQLYATDASAYEVTPIGVVFPESTADVASVMRYCADHEIPVLPRGGGTSLAGQAVNEAVVLDFTRHMDGLLDVDTHARTARAQAGAILGDIDAALESAGLKFAPDPAWGDKSALGGAIGNNSTGAHSLVYGKTDAYVESCEAVLADGTVLELGEIEISELRERAADHPDADASSGMDADLEARLYAAVVKILDEDADAIEAAYPDLKRNVSGYNVDRLIAESESGSVNLARVLCGSEGTLAVVTEATIALETLPETKAVALVGYDSLADAMADVSPILEHDPAAVEVMDDVLLGLASQTSEFADVVEMLPEGTRSVLLVEFYADSDQDGKHQVADLLADRVGDESATEVPASDGARAITDADRSAIGAMEAHDPDTRARFWKLRKSGLPILLSRTTDAKHISFIEDCAVPPEHLPEYVADFQEILDEHDTHASFYAHAGPGVLHVRPLIDIKTVSGLDQMEGIANAVTDLVVEHGGSVSGEHGDGRARTQWNRKLYGEDLWETFRDLKSAVDPDWLLNPGQVCGLPSATKSDGSVADSSDDATSDADAGEPRSDVDATVPSLTENLRFDPDYEFAAGFDPVLEWDNPNGLQGMVELCHGCGGCRGPQDTTGGVMCPTYRASEEEITSTRGRANLLRQAMSGDLAADATDVEFMTEVLDLCIGCKGCANDCPSEVDMAKLKAEVTHAHHEQYGASLRDRLFANVESLSWLGSRFAPVSNWASAVPGARGALESLVGIAADRDLPTFERHTFVEWFDTRGGSRVPIAEADRRALVLPDTYTNYTHPRAGRAAVHALESAGIHVALPETVRDSGRPAFSKGFLDDARATAEANVAELAPRVREGWDVIAIEPSDAVMYQSDYLDLVSPNGVSDPSGTLAAGEGGPQPAADGGQAVADGAQSVADSGQSMADIDGPETAVEAVAANTYGALEYLDRHRLYETIDFDAPDRSLAYHGHCHQKATRKDHHAVGVLRQAGYTVDPLDSGCCGMAGSFGYEAEHYSMSRAIASILDDQVAESPGDLVVAPGASCRSQLSECEAPDGTPIHPIEAVATAIVR